MKNKVVIVTGATAGIGKVTARELARMGAEVVIVGRNGEKCARVAAELTAVAGNPAVSYLVADLSSQDQVRQLTDTLMERYERLDVLVNNAGAMNMRRLESPDGIELTFAVNHLNYFLLTLSLLPVLQAAPSARIVNVASDAHHGGTLRLDDLEFKKRRYSGFAAYAQSKLANILFTYALARRLEGSTVAANVLHPGFVASRFATNNGGIFRLVPWVARIVGVNEDAGARTSVYLASSPEVAGVSGAYFSEGRLARSSAATYEVSLQEQLWQISEETTGVQWPVTLAPAG